MIEIKDTEFIAKLQKNASDILETLAKTTLEADVRTLTSLYIETLYLLLDVKKSTKKGD